MISDILEEQEEYLEENDDCTRRDFAEELLDDDRVYDDPEFGASVIVAGICGDLDLTMQEAADVLVCSSDVWESTPEDFGAELAYAVQDAIDSSRNVSISSVYAALREYGYDISDRDDVFNVLVFYTNTFFEQDPKGQGTEAIRALLDYFRPTQLLPAIEAVVNNGLTPLFEFIATDFRDDYPELKDDPYCNSYYEGVPVEDILA